ncbi:hypothetical protein PTSG_07896 [Salpingoeca rosetta]|uniref:RIC1 C-terminal alpha solenoid region domain-containing protein n=1 Tax=Salpingoeca rosetta (strain ATCC 50818 / BSB-021) TaxID=946362 RepID=F2UGM7_SALR5|nr:uncharacterized protein PTSG_07896 [Salpingoeca rosetta]EGD75777.1 hypothetical protein PTSG_07896 [Salpingoeca rosetta]|eukprot:XP_004991698.1 hypothetical protein PTSG_07896 [Salpingoeca rosetta]
MYVPVGRESVSRVGPCVCMGASGDGSFVVMAQPHALALFAVHPFEQISNTLHLEVNPNRPHDASGRSSPAFTTTGSAGSGGTSSAAATTTTTANTTNAGTASLTSTAASSTASPSFASVTSTTSPLRSHQPPQYQHNAQGSPPAIGAAHTPAFFPSSSPSSSRTNLRHDTTATTATGDNSGAAFDRAPTSPSPSSSSFSSAAPYPSRSGHSNACAPAYRRPQQQQQFQQPLPTSVGMPQHIVPLPRSADHFCVTTSKGYILFFVASDVVYAPGSGLEQSSAQATAAKPASATAAMAAATATTTAGHAATSSSPSSASTTTTTPGSIVSGLLRRGSAMSVRPPPSHLAGCPAPLRITKRVEFDPHAPPPRPLIAHTLTACCVLGKDVLCASKIGIIDFVPWASTSFDPARTIDLRAVCGGGGGGTGDTRGAADSMYAVSMMADSALNRVIVHMNSGAVVVLTFTATGEVKGTQLWSPAVPAVHVSINLPFHLVAVADATAKVSVFRLETDRRSAPHSLLYTLASPHASKVPPPDGKHRLLACHWSPDGYGLAQLFRSNTMSLHSVFGSHLADTATVGQPISPHACVWATPGYHVMYVSASEQPGQHHLCRVNLLRSARMTTPSLCHEESLVLVGAESMYINPDSGADADSRHNVDRLCDTQWQHVQIPQAYRESNGPIFTAAVDRTGQFIAVAAQRGLMHYNTLTGKWKMFGNVAHERDLICTAGLAWWRSTHIVVASYSEEHKTSQLQLYSRSENLDADRVVVNHKVSRDLVLINVLGDLIVAISSRRRVIIFRVSLESVTASHSGIAARPASTLEIVLSQDLSAHIPFLSSLTDVSLTYVAVDDLTPAESTVIEAKSMILNVAGHLHLFPIERVHDQSTGTSSSGLGDGILLATDVEAAWVPPIASTRSSSLLLDALWFSCGRMGLKVWFPLERTDLGASRRIMLTFPLDTCPLTLLFREAVVIGASVDAYQVRTPAGRLVTCNAVHRKTQLNMHPILRQLLRRGLSRPAKMIADTLTDLPYFPHLLELMLHHVLEDEAADPNRQEALLPTVIEFIQQYDQWLDIVVHCARKTEMAKWDYLFECVGSPKASFEACVRTRRLETGASYLMVVQALQDAATTRQQTLDLLRLCLSEGRWALATDLIRFYQATAESSSDAGEAQVFKPRAAMLYLLDLCQPLATPDWALVFALVLRNENTLQQVLDDIRPSSRAAKLVVRIQTHISTDPHLSEDARGAYLALLRTAADNLPSSDVTAIMTQDDIERELNYTRDDVEEEREAETEAHHRTHKTRGSGGGGVNGVDGRTNVQRLGEQDAAATAEDSGQSECVIA